MRSGLCSCAPIQGPAGWLPAIAGQPAAYRRVPLRSKAFTPTAGDFCSPLNSLRPADATATTTPRPPAAPARTRPVPPLPLAGPDHGGKATTSGDFPPGPKLTRATMCCLARGHLATHGPLPAPRARKLPWTFPRGQVRRGLICPALWADLAASILKRLSMCSCSGQGQVTHRPWPPSTRGAVRPLARPWNCRRPPTAEQETSPSRPLAGVVKGPMAWRLPDVAGQERWLITAAAGWTAPAELPTLPLPAWSLLEIMSAEAQVTARDHRPVRPQTLNWEAVGGIQPRRAATPGGGRGPFPSSGHHQAPGPPAAMQRAFGARTRAVHRPDTASPAARVVACAPWLDSAQGHLALAEVRNWNRRSSRCEPRKGATAALAGPLPYPGQRKTAPGPAPWHFVTPSSRKGACASALRLLSR